VATRSDQSKERVTVAFNWDDFAFGTSLENIPVEYSREPVSAEVKTGVILRLKKLNDIWNEKDVVELQSDILTLSAPPFFKVPETDESLFVEPQNSPECQPDPGFHIVFESDEFEDKSGELVDTFLKSAWGILEGRIDQFRNVHYSLQIRPRNNQHSIPEKMEEVSFTIQSDQVESGYSSLIGAHFKIYFYVYRSEYFEGFFNVKRASSYGRGVAGVRVYLDGFRVFPFGEQGDDWLGLDQIKASRNDKTPLFLTPISEGLKRPALLFPGNNQLLGAVHLSQVKHKGIQLPINRQGLIENDTFASLREFVLHGIYWLTIEYARRQAVKKSESSTPGGRVKTQLQKVANAINNMTELDNSTKTELNQLIVFAQNTATRREEELIGELSMLRVLAASGTAILLFDHQLQAMLNGLNNVARRLEDLRHLIPDSVESAFGEIIEAIQHWRELAAAQARQIGFLVGAESRANRRRLSIHNVVNDVVLPLQSYADEFGIQVENLVPKGLRTPAMFRSELFAILLSIFTNALKAVRATATKRIGFTAESVGKSVSITIFDTGCGLSEDARELAFQPLYTTSMPDPVLGVGTGLGLKIVQDLVQIYDGKAEFIDPPIGWVTALKIVLPLEV
jgi:signal transduction histidine kinase